VNERSSKATVGVVLGVLLLVTVYYAAFHLGRVERLDANVFNQFTSLRGRPHVSTVASDLAHLCNPAQYVWLCLIPLGIALYRRRGGLAATILLVLLGAGSTTEALKHVLPEHHNLSLIRDALPASTGTWPSGHATASMALALCLVLAVAPRWRPWAALIGAGFTLAVSYSFLTLGWHYPSDAIGGFLVAATWTFLGVLVRSLLGRRAGSAGRVFAFPRPAIAHELAPIAGGAVAALALIVAIALARPESAGSFARGHEHLIAAVLVLGTLAFSLAGSLVIVLRRAESARN
jgi:membrane-associated phospholipid phosphatase